MKFVTIENPAFFRSLGLSLTCEKTPVLAIIILESLHGIRALGQM
jgi:hypothetical protein